MWASHILPGAAEWFRYAQLYQIPFGRHHGISHTRCMRQAKWDGTLSDTTPRNTRYDITYMLVWRNFEKA
jgi:hypothetical protein